MEYVGFWGGKKNKKLKNNYLKSLELTEMTVLWKFSMRLSGRGQNLKLVGKKTYFSWSGQ